MGHRIYLGVLGPNGTYRAAYQQWGGHPVLQIPDIRADWQHTGRDMARYLAAYDLTLDGNGDGREIEYGHVTGPADFMDGLYLIDLDHDGVVHYVPNRYERWQLYSRHLLAGDDLFALDGKTIRCTGCNTVDEVTFSTADLDAVVTCEHCGRTETVTPTFTRHHTAP